MRSPCCQAKPTQGPRGLSKCSRCGGLYDAREIASGRIEGGDYSADPSARMRMMESGGPTGAPIRGAQRQLKGGL